MMGALMGLSSMKWGIVIPYLCESIKKICGRYGIQPTSKVAEPSKTYWSPQGQRPYGQPKWCHLLVPMWLPNM